MTRSITRAAALALIYIISAAHIGSPDAWFEGNAGPYAITVQVVTAGVIPGVARVYVRADPADVSAVTISANKFDVRGGAPPPEPTEHSSEDRALFSGKLWMMSGGSNSIIVNVAGKKGTGSVIVPVAIVAYSRLTLNKPMAAGLSAMGLFLFFGLVTIIGAAFREATLAPGDAPTPQTRRRARTAMGVASALVVMLLVGGWKWWNVEDQSYARNMEKPFATRASVSDGQLNVTIAEPNWIHRSDSSWLRAHEGNSWTPLIEDHGKLMHVFVIKDDMSAFAHLHPETSDSVNFPSSLPPLPAGRYRLFADIVHESGFPHTLSTEVTITASAGNPAAVGNPDDSWFVGNASKGVAQLSGGHTIKWLVAETHQKSGAPANLRFAVADPDGTPATLDPFLGMAGHAVVERDDGSVFVHLHPMGTISMASQMAFEMRQPGDTIRGQLGKRLQAAEASMLNSKPAVGSISFPYAFPKPGHYRVWVQVKIDGKIETAAFDANVTQ